MEAKATRTYLSHTVFYASVLWSIVNSSFIPTNGDALSTYAKKVSCP